MFRFRRRKKSSDPVAVVQRFVDAANRHDAQGVADCLHRDFDSIQPIYPSRNFRGSDQVRRNWQAIFQAEPGFRLTLLRSAASDGTVWVELHGAGREAEVAGVFIMGVENNLVRWARVYSAVVDQEFQGPEATSEQPRQSVGIDDGVEDPQVAAELREMVDAGRLRVAATGGPHDAGPDAEAVEEGLALVDPLPPDEPLADEAAVGDDDTILWRPLPVTDDEAPPSDLDDDSLDTGEVPATSPDAADDVSPEAADDVSPEAADDVSPETAADVSPEAVADVSPEAAAPTEASLEDVLDEASLRLQPAPAGDEPVIELVTPAGSAPPDDAPADGEGPVEHAESSPGGEGAVLELKPERRFRRPLRRS